MTREGAKRMGQGAKKMGDSAKTTRGSAKVGERQRRNRSGAWGETIAAALLIAKGYRILERRFSCPAGEIDIIAVRRRRLAIIEVKKRATLEAAHASITPHQRQRIGEAADWWLSRHARYHTYDICFDLIFVLPRRWPVHLEDTL